MDRGAWWAIVDKVARVGHYLGTKTTTTKSYLIFVRRCHMLGDDLSHFTFLILCDKYYYYFHFAE